MCFYNFVCQYFATVYLLYKQAEYFVMYIAVRLNAGQL